MKQKFPNDFSTNKFALCLNLMYFENQQGWKTKAEIFQRNNKTREELGKNAYRATKGLAKYMVFRSLTKYQYYVDLEEGGMIETGKLSYKDSRNRTVSKKVYRLCKSYGILYHFYPVFMQLYVRYPFLKEYIHNSNFFQNMTKKRRSFFEDQLVNILRRGYRTARNSLIREYFQDAPGVYSCQSELKERFGIDIGYNGKTNEFRINEKRISSKEQSQYYLDH